MDKQKIKEGIGFLIAVAITVIYTNWLKIRGDTLIFFLTLLWLILMYIIYKKFEIFKNMKEK